jgi:hypothetical protein
MRRVFIDERWIVDQYLMREEKKSWNDLETGDDLRVLTLERTVMAETLGVDTEDLPVLACTGETSTDKEIIEIDTDKDVST